MGGRRGWEGGGEGWEDGYGGVGVERRDGEGGGGWEDGGER